MSVKLNRYYAHLETVRGKYLVTIYERRNSPYGRVVVEDDEFLTEGSARAYAERQLSTYNSLPKVNEVIEHP